MVAAGLVLGACSSSKKSSTGGGSSTTAGASSAATGTAIDIGVVGTASGPQASSSAQYETVAPAWAAWVNANGGINGHQVKVITEDDGGNAATAQSQVETLINIRVARGGLVVTEVPSFEHARIHGLSNLSTFADGLRVLRTILTERHAGQTGPPRSAAAGSPLEPEWDQTAAEAAQ